MHTWQLVAFPELVVQNAQRLRTKEIAPNAQQSQSLHLQVALQAF